MFTLAFEVCHKTNVGLIHAVFLSQGSIKFVNFLGNLVFVNGEFTNQDGNASQNVM